MRAVEVGDGAGGGSRRGTFMSNSCLRESISLSRYSSMLISNIWYLWAVSILRV